jgi:hypothetical protein
MPFPHIWSVITWRLGSGSEIQLVSTLPLVVLFINEPGRGFLARAELERRKYECVQMFPIEHWEKFISPLIATGLIKYLPEASQVLVVSGQQALVLLHPSAHYGILCVNNREPGVV